MPMSQSAEHMRKTMVKNAAGDASPETDETQLRHRLAPPSAAVPAGTETHEAAVLALKKMTTEELRERAGQLAVDGHETMGRRDLLTTLAKHARKVLDA
jgi:hypothetical protein